MQKPFLVILTGIMIVLMMPLVLIAQETGETAPADNKEIQETTDKGNNGVLPSFVIELGFSKQEVKGNKARYRQYIWEPEGGFLSFLGIHYPGKDNLPTFSLAVKDAGERSQGGEFRLNLADGYEFYGSMDRGSFYRDWTDGTMPSSRKKQDYQMVLPVGDGDLKLQYDEIKSSLFDDGETSSFKDRKMGISYVTNINTWLTSLAYTKDDFSFKSGKQFNGDTKTIDLLVSPINDEKSNLEARLSMAKTSLDDYSEGSPGKIALAVKGIHVMNEDLIVSGNFRYTDFTDVITENAHETHDTSANFNAKFTGIPKSVVNIGGGLSQVDFVNGRQTMKTGTGVSSFFAKINTRLSKYLNLKASHSQDWTDDRPAWVDLSNQSHGSLIWSSRQDQRIEATYNPNWRTGITGRWRNLTWRHSDYATHNSLVEGDLFGWFVLDDNITLYTTYMNQNFGINLAPDINKYTTDNESLVYGLTWSLSPDCILDLSLTDSNSRGGTEVDQRIFTLGVDYHLSDDSRLSLLVSIDDFNTAEAAPDFDYEASWLEIRYAQTF